MKNDFSFKQPRHADSFSTAEPDIKLIYQNLTGVDISQQQRLWDERGKGYYGEYLVFSNLYPHLAGDCKILMNLEVPINGRTTEIDLLLIHETGIYIFEVKHYKGTIYGSGDGIVWTQYFRTTPNQKFKNPIAQNEYHRQAVATLFPNVPIYSFVVFTNDECGLKVEHNKEDVIVCLLQNLRRVFEGFSFQKEQIFDRDQIDAIFNQLKPYSKLTEETVVVDDEPVLFYVSLSGMKATFQTALEKRTQALEIKEREIDTKLATKEQEIKIEKEKLKTKNKKRMIGVTLAIVASLILCIAICLWFNAICNQRVADALAERDTMAQKFKAVGDLDDENIRFTNQLVSISNLQFQKSKDIENTLIFTCQLSVESQKYGIHFLENTKFVIKRKDGFVIEYSMFDETFKYNSSTQKLGAGALQKQGKLKEKEFYNIEIEDISFIKLINVGIYQVGYNNGKDLLTDMEIELYSAE